MSETNNHSPGLGTLLGRLTRTGVGALQNRVELLALEWREERLRMTEMMAWTVALLFLAMLGMLLLTATIIFLFPSEWRIYDAAGFTLFYLGGAVGAWFGLRKILKHEPFEATIDELKKDRAWLDSLK